MEAKGKLYAGWMKNPITLAVVGLLNLTRLGLAGPSRVAVVELDAQQMNLGSPAMFGALGLNIPGDAQGFTTLTQALQVAHPGPARVALQVSRILVVPNAAPKEGIRVGAFDAAKPLSWQIFSVSAKMGAALQERLAANSEGNQGDAVGAHDVWGRTFDAKDRRLLASLDYGGDGPMEDRFVRIEPGKFQMGRPEAHHEVTLTHPLLVQATPVTQDQYLREMEENPSSYQGKGRGRHPVERVSWYNAVEYANARSRRAGWMPAYWVERDRKGQIIEVGTRGGSIYETQGYADHKVGLRLPTEAETERFTLGGMNTIYPHGNDFKGLFKYAVFGLADGTREVATKLPNAFGLYDVVGLVWKWGHDWFGKYPDGSVENPEGPVAGSERVMRGGFFDYGDARHLRADFRFGDVPGFRYGLVGFRPVRSTSR